MITFKFRWWSIKKTPLRQQSFLLLVLKLYLLYHWWDELDMNRVDTQLFAGRNHWSFAIWEHCLPSCSFTTYDLQFIQQTFQMFMWLYLLYKAFFKVCGVFMHDYDMLTRHGVLGGFILMLLCTFKNTFRFNESHLWNLKKVACLLLNWICLSFIEFYKLSWFLYCPISSTLESQERKHIK